MKTTIQILKLKNQAACLLAVAATLISARFPAAGAETGIHGTSSGMVRVSSDNPKATVLANAGSGKTVVIEPYGSGGRFGQHETTWLGVATEEAPEALTAQLRLDPGVGLVVTYVATNSPASKAGLQKNDVLAEFDGQQLVLPQQLRKLVEVHKGGDTAKLVFYRAGKKQTVSATLAKTVTGFGFPGNTGYGDLYLSQFLNGPQADALRKQMQTLREQMGSVKVDRALVEEQIRRGAEEARRAYEQALRQFTNAQLSFDKKALRQYTNAQLSFDQFLRNFPRMGVTLDNDASVTVRSTGQHAKSLVKADDSGTIVLIKNPKLYLTAHNKNGKLLFDGEIDTPAQRAQVPRALWKKVEPLLEKMNTDASEQHVSESVRAQADSLSHGDNSSQ